MYNEDLSLRSIIIAVDATSIHGYCRNDKIYLLCDPETIFRFAVLL